MVLGKVRRGQLRSVTDLLLSNPSLLVIARVMLLYYSTTSPFVRKVLLAAKELGIGEQIKLEKVVTNALDPIKTQHCQINPSAKIPTLISDSGKAYFGSQTIVQYLDHVAGGNKIISQADFEARADALTLEAIADGVTDAAILIWYEHLRPDPQQWSAWTTGQTQKIHLGLKCLAKRLPSTQQRQDTIHGTLLPDPAIPGPFPLGGIAAASTLWYLDTRLKDMINWRELEEVQGLEDWYRVVQERPSWKEL
ncbi:hypothetical protein FRB94_012046 [Tulasnella sp. JGI-2019a]|nr:hypothetical protein FRB94_012046 [Tulasnella sp. JGI-2019a]KAG9039784.1 hypothetical protein FRB95_007211 [Tulasnella sp. JGI-2019a]